MIKYMLETNSKNLSEDQKFELMQLGIAETQRLCDLNKRLDAKAFSRENNGIRGAEWRLRSCWISEVDYIKAFQSGVLD